MIQAKSKRMPTTALAVGLLLLLAANLSAQQLYEPGPAVSLRGRGVVDQLVNGSANDHLTSPVGQASFVRQTSGPAEADWQAVLNASSDDSNAQTNGSTNDSRSFIEREKTSAPADQQSARELVAKISMNLLFVLALACGFILLARQWQKSRTTQHAKPSGEVETFKVSQVLPLAGGAALHVVEGFQNKCLVAIDSTGIKSVSILTPTFEQSLEAADELEAAEDAGMSEPMASDQSTAEIDENLIRLLLQNSRRAA